MKEFRLVSLIGACALLLAGVFIVTSQTASADVKTVNLSIRPEKVLFKVENMAPGDWAVRDLAIINDGESDLRYQVTLKYKKGKKLFNEMNLEIAQGSTSLYAGKLAGFKKLPPRVLPKNKEETLTFHAEFPPELGNEFQGAETEFDLIISAEEIKDGGGGTPGTTPLPPSVDPPKTDDPTNPDTPVEPKPGDPRPENPDSETPEAPDDDTPSEQDTPDDPTGGNESEPNNDSGDDDQNDDGTAPPASNSGGGDSAAVPGGTAKPAAGTGEPLPNTATNMFNYMLGGGILVLAGLASLVLAMRRKPGGKTL